MQQPIILLVDSSAAERMLYRQALEQGQACCILEAASGEIALAQCRRRVPNLILLEYQLSDMDGLMFIKLLQTQWQDSPPVVMLTAYGSEAIAVGAMKAGAWDYLSKREITPEQLCHSVHTALQQTKAALKPNEERLRLALSTANMGYWDWSIQTGQVVWSDNLEALFGLSPGSFDGRYETFLQTIHPDDRPEVIQAIEQAVFQGQDYALEFRVVWPDGSIRWAATKGQVYYDRDGKPERMTGVDLNITERKQIEEELAQLLAREQAARAEAEAANQAKDEFISMVSHDLRSPLNAILGWTQLLRSRSQDPALINRALEVIERNARSQAALLEDLLDVSRMVRGTLEIQVRPVRLDILLKAAIESMQPTAQSKALQLKFALLSTEADFHLLGDPDRLQQILSNLLSNAVKFTPEQGQIDVCLERQGNIAQLTVSDTGQGIKPELLPHIFDRFQQGKNRLTRQQGLGLGLAITRHLVELHGGSIQAASAGEDQGATFIVQLPLSLEASLRQPAAGDKVRR